MLKCILCLIYKCQCCLQNSIYLIPIYLLYLNQLLAILEAKKFFGLVNKYYLTF